ncbi:MAG: hypothetical protein E4H20_11155 [Spirochaetales bacterium]|nr:MAG: hypothetical protein E4H20_11155 [Spirochaetales bacterium]
METMVSNYLPYSYLYGASLSLGRVSVPVSPSQLPYANFKNVTGSAVATASVYSLDKLKILDVLIDRLRSARKNAVVELPAASEREGRLDAMIQEYGKQLHDAMTAANLSTSGAYVKPGPVVPGMLVTLAA